MRAIGSVSCLLLLVSAGCGDSADSNARSATMANKVRIAQASTGDYAVELLTHTRLETGMTPIYLRVMASGQPVSDATVTFIPLMTMSETMSHSAPVISSPTLDSAGDYHCDVVFQMASSDMGSWSATVNIARAGSSDVEVAFPKLTVMDSGRAKIFEYKAPESSTQSKYIVSLNFVDAPKIGLNPVVMTLHEKADAMSFTPVLDGTMTIDPQMPSMGHGSPGSVNPTATSHGRYEGQLSFSMAGAWETTVVVARNDITLGTVTFPMEF